MKDVTPLLTHWSYVFLALTRRYDDCCLIDLDGSIMIADDIKAIPWGIMDIAYSSLHHLRLISQAVLSS